MRNNLEQLTKSELLSMAKDFNLDVEGSGLNGVVLKRDLIKALTNLRNVDSNRILVRLKPTAPDQVVVKSTLYSTGVRTFSRGEEPFLVTKQEFHSVINRSPRYFEEV